jgi:hypothetical protein
MEAVVDLLGGSGSLSRPLDPLRLPCFGISPATKDENPLSSLSMGEFMR